MSSNFSNYCQYTVLSYNFAKAEYQIRIIKIKLEKSHNTYGGKDFNTTQNELITSSHCSERNWSMQFSKIISTS